MILYAQCNPIQTTDSPEPFDVLKDAVMFEEYRGGTNRYSPMNVRDQVDY